MFTLARVSIAAALAAVVAFAWVGWPATGQDPCPTPTPTATATPTPQPPMWTISSVSGFPGGPNTNNGTISNFSTGDPALTMRASTTQGGASYARGIIDRRPDGSPLVIREGDTVDVSLSVLFRSGTAYDNHYVSVARFDNYSAYGSPGGNLLGVERWSDNTLHLTAGTYGGTRISMLVGPTVQPGVHYELRFQAKISSTDGAGYSKLYVNDALVAESTLANNLSSRSFSKLRAGVVAVGAGAASVDFGDVTLDVK